ncbi:NHLP leader peptide family RiPP precursor [Pontibacter sp. G13]|uniref:NHLP leader peptide family RiPP precursor n=1 Tax=Pontibacter sp. G13 TaxID=3074898 RepID=UPI00288941B9|nr:NHLP leader peptide family RiPP precursor [Pontibacter sp. G13]WNJ16387.1 NHLP leader peptide family RiPP precursor [Pontibacter sp. G13]
MDMTNNQKIAAKMFEKAWKDPEFKSDLIANPEATIRESFGLEFELPGGKELVVVDQSDDSKVFVNIPSEPDLDEVELTDEELELIAGGGGTPDLLAKGLKL